MNNQRSVFEQRRIIYDPDNKENTKVPTMPLIVIILDSGVMGEACSIRGAATIVIGNEYLDSSDEYIDWHMRVEQARRECMKTFAHDDIEAVVFDKRKGIIQDNYAAPEDDSDYEIDSPDTMKIRVENDRLFLLSLLKAGAIKVLEREDSYFFRPAPQWERLSQSDGALKCCGTCWHRQEEEDKLKCCVYGDFKEKTDGKDCGSYMIDQGEYKEYSGGNYIDIGQDIDFLMEYFEEK